MYLIRIFSFRAGVSPDCDNYIRFPVHLWVICGSLRWTGGFWWSEPIHLGEPVQFNIIKILIEEITILASQVKSGLIFWYGLEVKQFLLYNISLIEPPVSHKWAINILKFSYNHDDLRSEQYWMKIFQYDTFEKMQL